MNAHSWPENTAIGWSSSELMRVPVSPTFWVLVMTSAMSPSSSMIWNGTLAVPAGTPGPPSVLTLGVTSTTVPS